MTNKIIVTHHHPDLDAVFSAWLLIRFLSDEYKDASFAFVPAGQTFKRQIVDSDENIVHVDTGLGKFDHHDEKRRDFSAGAMVYEYLIQKQPHLKNDKFLKTMVDFVTEIDHFGEYYWPEPLNPRYAFMLSSVIPALHHVGEYSNEEVMEFGFVYLDAVQKVLKDLVHSKGEIAEGENFPTKWGKGLSIESGSDGVMKVAQRMGYEVVVRRDPRTGFVKIKSAPKESIDLKPLYDKIISVDDPDLWFFHPSGHMLINGSSKNADVEPTNLDLKNIVQMIKELSKTNK